MKRKAMLKNKFEENKRIKDRKDKMYKSIRK